MIDIIPKIEERPPIWLSILFYFSIIFLLTAVVSIFSLRYLKNKAETSLSVIEQQIDSAKTGHESLEQEVLRYQQKIDDFSLLLNTHKAALNFFPFLEKVCHPKTQFTELTLSINDTRAGLSGVAESFEALEQQINILEKQEQIKEVYLAKISIAKEGGADFTLNIALNPSLFR